MTVAHKWTFAVLVAAVIVLMMVVRCWEADRELRASAEAKVDAYQQVVAAKDEAIKGRDAVALAYSSKLTQESAAVKTPQQAAQVVVRYMPAGEQQPIATVSKADLPASVTANLPDSASYSLLTDLQMKQVAKDELACDVTRNDLATCKADSADLRSEVAAKTGEVAALQVAVRGGTKWQRFGRVMKFVGCGAGGGYLGSLVKGNAGAGIGAAAGVAGCSLF